MEWLSASPRIQISDGSHHVKSPVAGAPQNVSTIERRVLGTMTKEEVKMVTSACCTPFAVWRSAYARYEGGWLIREYPIDASGAARKQDTAHRRSAR